MDLVGHIFPRSKRNTTQAVQVNSTSCLFQKLAALLNEAAEDNAYVDPKKIEKILGLTKEGSKADTGSHKYAYIENVKYVMI